MMGPYNGAGSIGSATYRQVQSKSWYSRKKTMADKVKDGLSTLRDMIQKQSENELFLLSVSGAVAAVTLEAVQRFTHIISEWANSANDLNWLRRGLQFKLLGGPLDVSKLLGVVIYLVVSLFFLFVVVFGFLGPLMGEKDSTSTETKDDDIHAKQQP